MARPPKMALTEDERKLFDDIGLDQINAMRDVKQLHRLCRYMECVHPRARAPRLPHPPAPRRIRRFVARPLAALTESPAETLVPAPTEIFSPADDHRPPTLPHRRRLSLSPSPSQARGLPPDGGGCEAAHEDARLRPRVSGPRDARRAREGRVVVPRRPRAVDLRAQSLRRGPRARAGAPALGSGRRAHPKRPRGDRRRARPPRQKSLRRKSLLLRRRA